MDSASSLAYPGSRVVAGWWRQLQPHQPAGLWVGYLFVHRVEALVECAEPRSVDALTLHLLKALAVDQGEPGAHAHGPDPLPGRLHLPAPALRQLLTGLASQDLVGRCERGCWCLSERGRRVLRDGADLAVRRERRWFPYVERLNSAGRRLAPPHFFPMHECPAEPWDVHDTHHFDPGLLHQSLGQTPEWKAGHDFPTGVLRILDSSAGSDNDWEQVIVDRPQRVAIALITTGTDGGIMGFAAKADSWKLLDQAPVLRLAPSVRDWLPELAFAPTLWEKAWRLWCRQRSLPRADAESCRLKFDGIHLDVHAPEAFVQRLRAAKSEALHEESGLLAGDGYLRPAALLRLQTLA